MAPSGIRNDGTTSGTSAGTTMTVPLRADLFQTPGSGRTSPTSTTSTSTTRTTGEAASARSTGSDGDKTVSLSSASGQRRTLQQIADSQGMTVAQLLAAPANSSLRNLYENQVQMMLDKYRTYEHQLKRATNRPLMESQVANDVSWIPTDRNTVHVPSRRAPDSLERLQDNNAVDRSEIDGLVSKVSDEKYRGVVRRALESTHPSSADGDEGVDLRELYSQGQDHLPLDAKLASFIYGQEGLRFTASHPWSVGSVAATLKDPVDLQKLDPSKVTENTIKQGMLVTSRDKSRLEIAVSNVETRKDGTKGVRVVCPDRSQGLDRRGMVREFRPLRELELAGYPKTDSSAG